MSMKLGQVASRDLMISGGCVRFDDDGVYLHVNSSHASMNIDSIAINAAGYLEVTHSPLGVVVSILCSPDETVSGTRGITGGGSGGTGSTRFRFYDTRIERHLDLADAGDYARIASAVSNVWLTWVHYLPNPSPAPLTIDSQDLRDLIEDRITQRLLPPPNPGEIAFCSISMGGIGPAPAS